MAVWSALVARPQRTPLSSRPSLTLYFLLAGAFLLTLVPHALEFPVWLTVMIVAAMLLRSAIEYYRLPLPSTTFCGILAVILFIITLAWFRTVTGREFGTALTAGLLAIKFYEIRQPRDIALIIFCCFFVVMSALLYSQVLELFVYCLIMMWVLTALLMRVHAGDLPVDRLLRMLGRSGLVFLQALPLTLLLFFFFPRYNGPLGLSLNDPPIGLTDRITPGSVAKLSSDDTPAMYVRFGSSGVPMPESTYWRAIVLWHYEHGAWTMGDGGLIPVLNPPAVTTEPTQQIITIRPNNQRWLYALDVPRSTPENSTASQIPAELYNDGTIRLSAGKLDHFARYRVVSSMFPVEEQLAPETRELGTELPPGDEISPAVRQLAQELHRNIPGGDATAYSNAVLGYFHHSGFIYTAAPGPQDKDWLTDFLLRRKTGFCEHFAAAYAVLMRLGGVPTRLIAGYQGYDYNPYDDEYTVSQSNAHAWDEIWEPSSKSDPSWGKWIRIDPTSFAGVGEGTTLAGAGVGDNSSGLRVMPRAPSFADAYFPSWLKSGVREVRLRREEVETNWDNLVLSYDTGAQFRLAEAMGFGADAWLKLFLVCLAAGGVIVFAFRQWLARKPAVSSLEFLYATFCRTMARRGLPRAMWEGPLAYTDRVAESFPDDRPEIQHVGAMVARARYGPAPADSDLTAKLETALANIAASQAGKPAARRPAAV